MKLGRELSEVRERLVAELIKRSNLEGFDDWTEGLVVEPMNDEGMGSLLLLPKGSVPGFRRFAKQMASLDFLDNDGVLVMASLNLDENGELFELDIWKVDFSPLIEIPRDFH